MKRTLWTLVLISASFGGSSLFAQDKAAPAAPTQTKNWYRVDITINDFDDSKKTDTQKFAIGVEEGASGVVRIGNRVPISTGGGSGFQYIDVGVDIHCNIQSIQGLLTLASDVDMSGISMPALPEKTAPGTPTAPAASGTAVLPTAPGTPVIHHVTASAKTLVTLAKPVLIASLDDPSTPGRKYTIEATVTKMSAPPQN